LHFENPLVDEGEDKIAKLTTGGKRAWYFIIV